MGFCQTCHDVGCSACVQSFTEPEDDDSGDEYNADQNMVDDESDEPEEQKEDTEVYEGEHGEVEDVSNDQALQIALLKRLPVGKSDYEELIKIAAAEYRRIR
jgi:hypothetical protein